MKLISYRADGGERYGIASGDGIIDATGRMAGDGIIDATGRMDGAATLRDVLEQERLAEMRELETSGSVTHELGDVEFLLPITAPRKILCAGRNYPGYHELASQEKAPEYPSIFARFASSFSPHQQPIVKPEAGEQLDYEGELVVVIGKGGRHISKDDAFAHVAGYTCMNEGTVRDWMKKGTQNTPAKNFDRSGGLGPWIVTADEIAEPSKLRMTTRRNGEVVQEGRLERMLFSIPYLIAHVSTFTLLEPGDLIATGSPGGSAVESDSPRWLGDGDVVEIEIENIGKLRNPIVAEGVLSSRG